MRCGRAFFSLRTEAEEGAKKHGQCHRTLFGATRRRGRAASASAHLEGVFAFSASTSALASERRTRAPPRPAAVGTTAWNTSSRLQHCPTTRARVSRQFERDGQVGVEIVRVVFGHPSAFEPFGVAAQITVLEKIKYKGPPGENASNTHSFEVILDFLKDPLETLLKPQLNW